jgi:hypothetical protein
VKAKANPLIEKQKLELLDYPKVKPVDTASPGTQTNHESTKTEPGLDEHATQSKNAA